MTAIIKKFAGDPFAPTSAQFALHGTTFTERIDDQPSQVGIRPWGLRRARPAGRGREFQPGDTTNMLNGR
jgi:hypothetical protein